MVVTHVRIWSTIPPNMTLKDHVVSVDVLRRRMKPLVQRICFSIDDGALVDIWF